MDQESMQELLKENFVNIKDEIKTFFKSEIGKVTTEVNELKNSIDFLSSQYDDLIQENKVLKAEINSLKSNNAAQSLKIENLDDSRRQCSKRLNVLDNLSRLNNLELHGTKYSTGEKSNRIAFNILKMVNADLMESDIVETFRVKKGKRQT